MVGNVGNVSLRDLAPCPPENGKFQCHDKVPVEPDLNERHENIPSVEDTVESEITDNDKTSTISRDHLSQVYL